ncbi:MAG: hypothetical protein IJ987_00865 [Firmicutes bacterium]|nr:hypothetical protein [Bacillota bacterium]
MILGFFGKEIIASPINCGAVAMILSLIIVPAVSMITAKPSETRMEEVFSCYEEKVLVSKRNALED